MNKTNKASRTITALLDFTAIGIQDTVFKVDIWQATLFYEQDLIGPDTKLAMCEFAPNHWGNRSNVLASCINNDKVIASAMHFGKA
jgi:hypothetical protein